MLRRTGVEFALMKDGAPVATSQCILEFLFFLVFKFELIGIKRIGTVEDTRHVSDHRKRFAAPTFRLGPREAMMPA